MRLYSKIFLILISLTAIVIPQIKGEKYQVDMNEINGELNSKDLYRKDFGRYDGYQIDLYDGEAIHFLVSSKVFQPSLALVNSKGEIIFQSKRNQEKYAEILCLISSSDKYILYVIGNEKDAGKYNLQTAIAEPNAFNVESKLSFCDGLEFLSSHSKAYFSFLENTEFFKGELVKLENSTDVYFDEEDGSYKAVYLNDNDLQKAENIFEAMKKNIKSCLGREWQTSSAGWDKTETGRMKSFRFEEKGTVTRYIEVVLLENAALKMEEEKKYTVEIKINRS